VTADDKGSRPTGWSTTPAPGPSGAPEHESLDGVARDATTLLEVLRAFEAKGFNRELAVREGGAIECLTCRRVQPAGSFRARALRRLEGASDPDDMLAVAALVCPNCGSRGTLVLNYGPLASAEDAAVLRELDEPPPPTPDLGMRRAG
jgi:hypothetical protein